MLYRSDMRDTERWRAVIAHDARFDGAFVYAVRSTRIYCRPSCPSRRPARRHVVFFSSPGGAEQKGFRACRRCVSPRPGASITEMVRSICRYIDQHTEAAPRLRDLAAHAGMSPFHLQRTFKRITGVTPRQYADERRVSRLKRHLREARNVTDAIYEAGYGSSSRLYENSSTRLGMKPRAYRRGGHGTVIRYTIAASPLGQLLVAGTTNGICRVMLGDTVAGLEAELGREYPAARTQRADRALGRWVRAILAELEGDRPHINLPLDIRATAFQRRVWEALRTIPRGTTRSYGQIARAIGMPGAARAVGAACAANPVALLIPCHRVVRGDGSPGGYRWGGGRKKLLLEKETRPRRG